MKYIFDFLHLKAPRSGYEMPEYYRAVLNISEVLLAIYFFVSFFLLSWATGRWVWFPVLMFALVLGFRWDTRAISTRMNLLAYAAITAVWCWWFVRTFGWSCGGQHILLPILTLIFFNIYDPAWLKILSAALLLLLRMGLFYWSIKIPAVYALSHRVNILVQTVNSVMLFIILAVHCIVFSTSIQDTERQLRIDNQELHKEAGTDTLTELPNRRAMIDEIERFQKNMPKSTFSVAIADIDFFKSVNDRFGHDCGDYTLKKLSQLFQELSKDNFSVCRWGGEEFCFFLPGKNIEEAWDVMFRLNKAVKVMPLSFAGHDFSITITIGIEENDFRSGLDALLKQADQKLYLGKNSGRDQVVI